MTLAMPAHAQLVLPEDPLSRDIHVYQYKIDPVTGAATVSEQWPWLDFARYYDLLMQFPAVAFVPEYVAHQLPTDPAPILIEERTRSGRVLRQILIRNNTIKVTALTYITKDFSDVDNIYDMLRNETVQRANDNLQPTQGGFFDIKSIVNGANFSWSINKQADTIGLWDMMQKMPVISDFDKTKIPNDFNDQDAVHITIDQPKKDQPNMIDFDNFQARFTYIDPITQTYYDRINFEQYALGQKVLAKFYKDRQIKPPPKTY